MLNQNSKLKQRDGLTLVELLVVISILAVITALLIPRLRVINKDRNIREAARTAASALAKASNRAVDEGVAGLMIERNPNIRDLNDVPYAATKMFVMRKVPPYAGDDIGATATVTTDAGTGTMTIAINEPLEWSANNDLVRQHDLIRLNHNSVLYPINSVPILNSSSSQLEFTVDLGSSGSIRPTLVAASYPFVIYRQPKKLESSLVNLPDGYYIDLRVSGPLVPTPAAAPTPPDWERGSIFDVDATTSPASNSLNMFFDSHGGIDRFAVGTASANPLDAFYFFVTTFETDEDSTNTSILQDEAGMWVTIDRTTGSVNVAYNLAPPTALSVFNQIQFARGLSRTRRSANQ